MNASWNGIRGGSEPATMDGGGAVVVGGGNKDLVLLVLYTMAAALGIQN